jgi:hypothetical protein
VKSVHLSEAVFDGDQIDVRSIKSTLSLGRTKPTASPKPRTTTFGLEILISPMAPMPWQTFAIDDRRTHPRG